MSKPQLHWSQLNMLLRCGAQFEFRYVKGIKSPPSTALIVGSAVHKPIEKNMKHKIETGTLLPLEAVKEAAVDAVNRGWDEAGEVILDEEEKSAGVAATRGENVDTAVSLSALHHAEVAPAIKPLHVERKFVLELNGFPYDLCGTIDLEETQAEGFRIRDTKTAKRSPNADTADSSGQLTMYSLAVSVLDGVIPPSQLDTLVKTKTPKVVIQQTTRTKEDFQILLRRLEVAARSIESGIFLPCASDSWACDPRYCGYYSKCSFVKGTK